jgi:hypothetical protein
LVTETTADSIGSTVRETIVWSAWTMAVPTMIGSTVVCGLAAWPPTPPMVMVNSGAGCGRQRHQRLHQLGIFLRHAAAAGKRGFEIHRDDGMIDQPE